MIQFGVAILSGGQGRRMGGGKPARRLGGRSLLELALAKAAAWSEPTVVVFRSAEPVAPAGVPVILDDPVVPGPLGGLAAALIWADATGLDAVLTLPCDMPFLPNDLPQRLVEAIGPEYGAALAVSAGRRHPICALWRTRVLQDLGERAHLGLHSLRGLAETVGVAEAHWPVEPFDPFFNINTPQDLRDATGLLQRSSDQGVARGVNGYAPLCGPSRGTFASPAPSPKALFKTYITEARDDPS